MIEAAQLMLPVVTVTRKSSILATIKCQTIDPDHEGKRQSRRTNGAEEPSPPALKVCSHMPAPWAFPALESSTGKGGAAGWTGMGQAKIHMSQLSPNCRGHTRP